MNTNAAACILIVEDDPEMGMGLEDFFSLKGYEVARATEGDQALQLMTTLPPERAARDRFLWSMKLFIAVGVLRIRSRSWRRP